MVSKMGRVLAIFATLAVVGTVAFADDETDGKKVKAAPKFVVQKLDTKTKTVTTYKVDALPENMTAAELEKMSDEDRKKAVETFLTSVAKPENQIATASAEKVVSKEVESGTPACGWYGWGGYRYGYGFRGGWGGWGRAYYNPYWTYGGWGGGGGWYGGGWGGCGSYCGGYGSVYTMYGCI